MMVLPRFSSVLNNRDERDVQQQSRPRPPNVLNRPDRVRIWGRYCSSMQSKCFASTPERLSHLVPTIDHCLLRWAHLNVRFCTDAPPLVPHNNHTQIMTATTFRRNITPSAREAGVTLHRLRGRRRS